MYFGKIKRHLNFDKITSHERIRKTKMAMLEALLLGGILIAANFDMLSYLCLHGLFRVVSTWQLTEIRSILL